MATISISLPKQIAQKVDTEAKKHGFATRSEFIRSLLCGYYAKGQELEFEEFKPVPLDQLRADLERTGKYNQKFINSVIKGFKRSSIYADKTS